MKKGGLIIALFSMAALPALGKIEERTITRSFDLANRAVVDLSNPHSNVSPSTYNKEIDNIFLTTENEIKDLLSETLGIDIDF